MPLLSSFDCEFSQLNHHQPKFVVVEMKPHKNISESEGDTGSDTVTIFLIDTFRHLQGNLIGDLNQIRVGVKQIFGTIDGLMFEGNFESICQGNSA